MYTSSANRMCNCGVPINAMPSRWRTFWFENHEIAWQLPQNKREDCSQFDRSPLGGSRKTESVQHFNYRNHPIPPFRGNRAIIYRWRNCQRSVTGRGNARPNARATDKKTFIDRHQASITYYIVCLVFDIGRSGSSIRSSPCRSPSPILMWILKMKTVKERFVAYDYCLRTPKLKPTAFCRAIHGLIEVDTCRSAMRQSLLIIDLLPVSIRIVLVINNL